MTKLSKLYMFIVYKFVISKNIKQKFSDKVLKLADKIAFESISKTEYKNRIDLRDEIIFTMDGEDSKDLDDAISIKKLENRILRIHENLLCFSLAYNVKRAIII